MSRLGSLTRSTIQSAALAALTALVISTAAVQLALASSKSEGEQSSADSAGPTLISAGRIPSAAREVQVLLDQIESRAEPSAQVERIAEEVSALLETIGVLAVSDSRRLSEDLHHRVLIHTVADDWSARSSLLQGWYRVVSRRSEVLAKDIEHLAATRNEWSVTRAEATSAGLTEALVARVDEVLAEVGSTRDVVGKQLELLLQLLDRIEELKKTSNRVLDDVKEATTRVRDQIFTIDSPPVWGLESSEDESIAAEMLVQLRGELGRVGEQLSRQAADFGFVAFLIAGLVIVLRRLSALAQRLSRDNDTFASPARILARPVSGGCLIALLIVIFTFSLAPLLTAILAVILALPVGRLLPGTQYAGVRRPLLGLAIWLIIETARQNLVADPVVSRLILLLESGVVLLVASWLLRPSRLLLLRDVNNRMRVLSIGVRLLIPMALISLVSNAVGNVALAEVLIEASLLALYLAVVLTTLHALLAGAWATILHTNAARKLRMVQRHEPLIRQRGYALIRTLLFLFWGHSALEAFRIRETIYDGVWGVLTARSALGDINVSLGDFVRVAFIVWLSFAIARLVRFILDDEILPRASLPRGVPFAISTAARYVILLTGFMMAVAASGIDTSQFALMVGALGVGIGIGLQEVVNNFVSGLIILFERPIQVGDTVEIDGLRGEIRQIGLRASMVRTFDGAEVVVPNSSFVSRQFVNWTLSDRRRRIDLPVGVAYGTDPERVIDLLRGVASDHPDILSDPQPTVLFMGLGDSSLDFEIRAWTARIENWRRISSEIGVSVIHALDAADIEIPFPQRDLHLRSVSSEVTGN